MVTLNTICDFMHQLAPLELAEEWDNVGLLIGDADQKVDKVLVCLTLTPNVVDEAIEKQVTLVITHHPLPFRSFKRITTDTVEGRSLWRLIGNQIAVYSAHTAFDSAREGINQQLAEHLHLKEIAPFVPTEHDLQVGTGRTGIPAAGSSLQTIAEKTKKSLQLDSIRIVGKAEQPVSKVAIACGSGGSLLDLAYQAGCDLFLTGEATFHDCLKAEALGVGVILTGHYASERFAMERLAAILGEQFPEVNAQPSASEKDPLSYI